MRAWWPVWWLAAIVLVAAVPTSAPVLADVGARSPAGSVDGRMAPGDCRLLGRVVVPGRGCSRTRCQPGARLAKAARGAEVCALPRQGDYTFGAAVDYRRCADLGRRWIAGVNWCASNPDRSRTVVPHAAQCVGRADTYVTHTEREGRYDECLLPARVRRLAAIARREGTTLEREALVASPTLCSYRPGHVFTDGRCVVGHDPDDLPGGTLLVGDSIAWRGTDELGRLRPDLFLDGLPSRRLSELPERLDAFRLDHGQPDGLVVELGTNPATGFGKAALGAVLDELPETTVVMLVLPYRSNPHAPPRILPASTHVATWMRELARLRPHTCVADWRAEVADRPGLLVDGVHPTSAGEGFWARWVARAWRRCAP